MGVYPLSIGHLVCLAALLSVRIMSLLAVVWCVVVWGASVVSKSPRLNFPGQKGGLGTAHGLPLVIPWTCLSSDHI